MIQFIDLAGQYQRLKDEIDKNIHKVLDHGKYIMGPEVAELEKGLVEFANVKHAVSCSNGTDALLMVLMAWGIGKGDAVFTTPFTFIATAEVVSLVGATPVYVDIDRESYNLDPNLLEAAIEKVLKEGKLKPKAIIPVDLFGLPADYDSINQIAKKYKLKVLEDAAQGFGATYKGKIAGSLGDAAGTSFFPAKPLGCYGDGGAVFTDDDDLAVKLKSIRVHGKGQDKYENVRIGLNCRLDTIQAAILLAKLAVFKEEIDLRNGVAAIYKERLGNLVKTPSIPEGCISTWAQYSVLASNSDEKSTLRKNLEENGIPTAVYYPIPLHLQVAFKNQGYGSGDFPVSEDVSKRIFSLPMHPYLTEDVVDKIAEVIKNSL